MVGEKMRKWREANGNMSTRDAADRAGVSQPVWLGLEKGTSKRTGLEVAMRIVSLHGIGITLDELVAEERKHRGAVKPKKRRRRSSMAPAA